MHYPWWYIEGINAPLLIAFIATVHVYVAMYAVGGGIILGLETGRAHKKGLSDILDYLKSHLKFFILLTLVFGAITGVGIWWIISLASPLATEALIHVFVFGWSMEYVLFITEISAALIFYYYWGKLKPEIHSKIGYIYAAAAWLTLVLITGITSFMLTTGGFVENKEFWIAFFNPQTIPQIIARTGGSLLLASLYIYLHSSFKLRDNKLLSVIEKRIAAYALTGALLTLIGGGLWYLNLPESGKASLTGAATLNILMGLVFVSTAIVFLFFYFGSYRGKGLLSPGYAMLLFAFGLIAVGASEFIREAVRKPFIVYDYVYGHQIYKDEQPIAKANGFLNTGVWTKPFILNNFPEVNDGSGKISDELLLALSKEKQVEIGKTLFIYHCNNCHAISGASGIKEITRGWTRDIIHTSIVKMDRIHHFMPPWSGTKAEAELLTNYLESIRLPHPFLDYNKRTARALQLAVQEDEL